MELKQRIMITRPARQAGNLSTDIEMAGGESFLFPTLEIQHIELSAEDKKKLEKIKQYDMIVFISPNAVEHGLEHLLTNSPLPKNIQLATIGQGSAKTLENKLGKTPDISPEQNFNSEGLLATSAMQNVADKSILIIRGNAGREQLKNTLEQRGAFVDYLTVYQRIKPDIDSSDLVQYLQNNEIAVIVITSAASLNNLLEMTPASAIKTLLQTPLLLINKRLVDIANKAGFKNKLIVAMEASDKAIIETLKENNLLKSVHQQ